MRKFYFLLSTVLLLLSCAFKDFYSGACPNAKGNKNFSLNFK